MGGGLLDRLDEVVERSGVPGVSVAVLVDGALRHRAWGLLNVATGVEATSDSLFQIGSVTKVFTATALMLLVDRGELDLDTPVVWHLPGLSFADPVATGHITTRHLLSHTSGLDGDIFAEFGHGDDRIERYVAALAQVPVLFRPGTVYSYSNAGYVVAGRLLEVLCRRPWAAVIGDDLLAPLDLTDAACDLQELLLHRVAVGHRTADGQTTIARPWAISTAMDPAGASMCASPSALVRLAEAITATPSPLLSATALATMLEQLEEFLTD